MSAELRTSLMATFGALVVRLVTSGRYRAYVQPRMGLLLLLAALALIGAAGSLGARLMLHPPSNPHPLRHNEAGSLHWHASRFELLLIAPVVLLAVMPATPLGAAAAAMRAGTYRTPAASLFPPLSRAPDGTVSLTVSGFVSRALYDGDGSSREFA